MATIPHLDVPPPGWYALDVVPRKEARAGVLTEWVALVVDVHPDELKHCQCKIAMLYVDPNEHRPGNHVAREAWLRIPGRHRSKQAAWSALQGLMQTRH
jgi:hypothetical protein